MRPHTRTPSTMKRWWEGTIKREVQQPTQHKPGTIPFAWRCCATHTTSVRAGLFVLGYNYCSLCTHIDVSPLARIKALQKNMHISCCVSCNQFGAAQTSSIERRRSLERAEQPSAVITERCSALSIFPLFEAKASHTHTRILPWSISRTPQTLCLLWHITLNLRLSATHFDEKDSHDCCW